MIFLNVKNIKYTKVMVVVMEARLPSDLTIKNIW